MMTGSRSDWPVKSGFKNIGLYCHYENHMSHIDCGLNNSAPYNINYFLWASNLGSKEGKGGADA